MHVCKHQYFLKSFFKKHNTQIIDERRGNALEWTITQKPKAYLTVGGPYHNSCIFCIVHVFSLIKYIYFCYS